MAYEKAVVPEHGRNCAAWKDLNGYDVNGEDCTCGLRWRVEIQTLQTLKAAWEKRAYQAESELADALTAARLLDTHLAEKFYPETTGYEPAREIGLVLVQIENKMSGLKRTGRAETRIEVLEAALRLVEHKLDQFIGGQYNQAPFPSLQSTLVVVRAALAAPSGETK